MKKLLAAALLLLAACATEEHEIGVAPAELEAAATAGSAAPEELVFEADGEGAGLAAASCTADLTFINKAKHTMNTLYACSSGSWQNTASAVEQWNNTCWSNGQQRRIRVKLLDQPLPNCRYRIYRSKSGPTSSMCEWFWATCQPTQSMCTLQTFTGTNNCIGYN